MYEYVFDGVLSFGKYCGHTPEEVIKLDRRYARWAARNFDGEVGDAFRALVHIDDSPIPALPIYHLGKR
jgi:hypothetical protein